MATNSTEIVIKKNEANAKHSPETISLENALVQLSMQFSDKSDKRFGFHIIIFFFGRLCPLECTTRAKVNSDDAKINSPIDPFALQLMPVKVIIPGEVCVCVCLLFYCFHSNILITRPGIRLKVMTNISDDWMETASHSTNHPIHFGSRLLLPADTFH